MEKNLKIELKCTHSALVYQSIPATKIPLGDPRALDQMKFFQEITKN